MTIEECTERWLIQIERIICLIENEFFLLNEEQLNYRLHVNRCNIGEIMSHLNNTNKRLILNLNQSIPMINAIEGKQEYAPGWAGRYFLSHARLNRCVSTTRNRTLPGEGSSVNTIFSALLEQENKLKELIISSTRLDVNRKVVPFWFSGILKLSLGETLEYLVHCQQSHFTQARHLLKIQ
jgi:hypothetical protein